MVSVGQCDHFGVEARFPLDELDNVGSPFSENQGTGGIRRIAVVVRRENVLNVPVRVEFSSGHGRARIDRHREDMRTTGCDASGGVITSFSTNPLTSVAGTRGSSPGTFTTMLRARSASGLRSECACVTSWSTAGTSDVTRQLLSIAA